MKKLVILLLAVGLFLPVAAAAQIGKPAPKPPKLDAKALPEQYRDFLDLTAYIITDAEKDIFMRLNNNRDRDLFVENFWKLRDPTPGTPENEYKEEIVRRFNYANKRFGTGRPGWMTDRGKFYIILGEPRSYDRYPGTSGIVPCEVWYYYTDGTKGLPAHFGLIFYQKNGGGDYKLYDPFMDGPKALILNTTSTSQISYDDYETLYDKIREMAPALASMSLSLTPGDYDGFNFQPSPRNTMILANIIESPKTEIRPTYATHFLDYKGVVSTEYLTNYIETQGWAAEMQDPVLDMRFVHLSLVPQKLTLDYYQAKDQYFCAFKLSVSLRKGDTVVYQYTKDYSLEIPANDTDRTQKLGIALEDTFPVVEGRFHMSVLLQNTTGKEFSVFEQEIGEDAPAGGPRLEGPFLGYKLDAARTDLHMPFGFADRKLVFDPKVTFSAAEDIHVRGSVLAATSDLWQGGDVQVSIKGQRPKDPVSRSSTIKLAEGRFGKVIALDQTIPAREITPDYYEIQLSLRAKDGTVLDQKTGHFIVSPEGAVAHPIIKTKAFPLANQFFYFYQLAGQYDALKRDPAAGEAYAKAFALRPENKDGVVEYVNYLLKAQKYDDALKLCDNLKDYDKGPYNYHLLRGLALLGKTDYANGIASLLEANKIYNSDTRLLNALGGAYARTGRSKDALEAYRASLKLNPEQPDIKQIVQGLEK